MKEEIAFLLGALEDGSFSSRPKIGDYTIEIEQKNREWLQLISKIFEKQFNKKPTISFRDKRKVFRLRIYSKKIFTELKKLREQMVEKIRNENRENKVSFLRGIFDAEGSVHKRRFTINLSNKKDEVIELCKDLLSELQIRTGKIEKMKRNVKRLHIYGKDNLQKFQELIGFSHPEKAKRLESLLSR